MDPIQVFPEQWQGEIEWQTLENIVHGLENPNDAFVRRMAAELRKYIGPNQS